MYLIYYLNISFLCYLLSLVCCFLTIIAFPLTTSHIIILIIDEQVQDYYNIILQALENITTTIITILITIAFTASFVMEFMYVKL